MSVLWKWLLVACLVWKLKKFASARFGQDITYRSDMRFTVKVRRHSKLTDFVLSPQYPPFRPRDLDTAESLRRHPAFDFQIRHQWKMLRFVLAHFRNHDATNMQVWQVFLSPQSIRCRGWKPPLGLFMQPMRVC